MSAKYTPCDSGQCPYGEGTGMYFCRDHCGVGADENTYPKEGCEDEAL